MPIRRIEPGARMSQAVIHANTVCLAGQVAANKPGASVGEQTEDILAGIDKLLAAAGTNKSRLLTANIWLADIATFDEMNRAWEAWVSPGNTPARATVEARLAGPQWTVEIMVTAALPEARPKRQVTVKSSSRGGVRVLPAKPKRRVTVQARSGGKAGARGKPAAGRKK